MNCLKWIGQNCELVFWLHQRPFLKHTCHLLLDIICLSLLSTCSWVSKAPDHNFKDGWRLQISRIGERPGDALLSLEYCSPIRLELIPLWRNRLSTLSQKHDGKVTLNFILNPFWLTCLDFGNNGAIRLFVINCVRAWRNAIFNFTIHCASQNIQHKHWLLFDETFDTVYLGLTWKTTTSAWSY